jgi:hypothetical protein
MTRRITVAIWICWLAPFATPEDAPAVSGLVVPEGAVEVARSQGVGEATVEYLVRDESPGTKTLIFITSALQEEGWRPDPDARGLTPPQVPSRDTSSADHVAGTHTWWAAFRNDDGDEVHYSLIRRCPLEQHGLHSVYLRVVGSYFRKDVAAQRRAEAHQATHGPKRRKEKDHPPEKE